jgi:hypothetical protein
MLITQYISVVVALMSALVIQAATVVGLGTGRPVLGRLPGRVCRETAVPVPHRLPANPAGAG